MVTMVTMAILQLLWLLNATSTESLRIDIWQLLLHMCTGTAKGTTLSILVFEFSYCFLKLTFVIDMFLVFLKYFYN